MPRRLYYFIRLIIGELVLIKIVNGTLQSQNAYKLGYINAQTKDFHFKKTQYSIFK